MMESEVMGNYHASFGERDGETRTVRIVKVRTVPTPLSPLLANVALDGMERLFDAEDADGRPQSPAFRKGLNKGISLNRYADDFVTTAPTREVLETYARPRLENFLQERGLALNEVKTRIIHIKDGFNFL